MSLGEKRKSSATLASAAQARHSAVVILAIAVRERLTNGNVPLGHKHEPRLHCAAAQDVHRQIWLARVLKKARAIAIVPCIDKYGP